MKSLFWLSVGMIGAAFVPTNYWVDSIFAATGWSLVAFLIWNRD